MPSWSRPAGPADLAGPAGRVDRVAPAGRAGGAGPGPAGRCGRATAAGGGSCRRAGRAGSSCRRRRPASAPGRAICRFSSIDCNSCSSCRAASLAPMRAICSKRSIMFFRSCGRIWRALGSSGRASCSGLRRICSASACRNLSSAARRSSVSFLSSSSVAPRSSAWRSASCAARSAASVSETLPSSSCTAMSHMRVDDVAQLVVALGAHELRKDRVQAEIDVALDIEFLRRHRQRIERGEHARLRIAVEREDAPLLDQRARHRLGERPLRQLHFERLARALVAGFVARSQRHRHIGAGPRMFAQVLGGLADAVPGARLRQHQREIGRLVERARGIAVGAAVLRGLKGRLRADDAVVVFELVGQLAARRGPALPDPWRARSWAAGPGWR